MISGGAATMAKAVSMTEFVNNNSGLDVSLWTSAVGPEPGSLVWSSLIEHQSELIAANDKLAPMEEYWALADAMSGNVTPMEDALRMPIHMTGELASDDDYVTVMLAQAANSLPDAVAWSTEMADLASEISGTPVVLSANSIGPMGQLMWLSTAPDIDTVENRSNALWADGRYMEKLASAAGLFATGVGGAAAFRRIA